MNCIEFPNKFVDHHRALTFLTQNQIRTMPMLYRADLSFALQKAPILWDFVSHLPINPFEYKYQSLDVKVTMLKRGWYPCIPGWHLDDFYRPTGAQPDLVNLHKHMSKHFMVVYGDASLTEFLTSSIELPHWMERIGQETIYGFYNRKINEMLEQHKLSAPILSEHLYEFDSTSFHRGLPATRDGWRAFVRLTLGSERPPKNEVRSQVNVYVPHDELEAGW